MEELHQMPVVRYDVDHVANPNPAGSTSFEDYHEVRGALVICSRRHGPTGPLGAFLEQGDPNPVYYIIDDQYNDEMYLYIEIEKGSLTQAWVEDARKTLQMYPGWALCIKNITNAYIILFADKLMVNGPIFSSATNAREIVDIANEHLF